MGQKSDLKPEEKTKILQLLNLQFKLQLLQIATRCGRGQIRANIERFVAGKSVLYRELLEKPPLNKLQDI